jgi:hypothetical protein
MSDVLLNVRDHLPAAGLIPTPIQPFRSDTQLDDQIPGKILRLYLAALFAPQPK